MRSLILLVLGLSPLGWARPQMVYLYVDRGVWSEGVDHLRLFFKQHHYPVQEIDHKSLMQLNFQNGLIVVPGGESWTYIEDMGLEGLRKIYREVHQGASYFGICAGAYLATLNIKGSYFEGLYGIGLLNAVAYDGNSFSEPAYASGLKKIEVFEDGLFGTYTMSLFKGPYFILNPRLMFEQKAQALARYQETQEIAMLRLELGQGKVLLSGPHLEIEESRTDWGSAFDDPESDWPLMNQLLNSM